MKLTRAEWQLMNALWKGHPATARDIAQRLPSQTKWAYTTIKTMLSRLVAKGVVAEEKREAASFYEPLLTRRKARVAALGSLVADAFDGAFGSLMHFIVEEEKLSPAERRKLRGMLGEKPGRREKR